MRVGRTVIAALLLALTVATPAGAQVAAPGRASGFYTWPGGDVLTRTVPVTYDPYGMDVYVRSGTAHASELTRAMQYAVGQQRRYGVAVRYRGAILTNVPPIGAVVVSETDSSRGVCRSTGAEREANTVQRGEDVGFAHVVVSATITFCPAIWPHGNAYVTSLALHELGHAVGLGHFSGRFDGSTQVMSPVLQFGAAPTQYQAGDVAGLRYVAAEASLVRSGTAPAGAITSWRVDRASVTVRGRLVSGRSDLATQFRVTRDGTVINSAVAGLDVPGRLDYTQALTGGRHTYCVVGLAAFGEHTISLGCRQIVYAAPVPSSAASVEPSTSAPPSAPSSASPSTPAATGIAAPSGHRSRGWFVGGGALLLVGLAAAVLTRRGWLRRRRRC